MSKYLYVITNAQTGEVTQIPYTQAEIDALESPFEKQQEVNKKSRDYLSSTDWYVIRLVETGIEVPDNILKARHEARNSIV